MFSAQLVKTFKSFRFLALTYSGLVVGSEVFLLLGRDLTNVFNGSGSSFTMVLPNGIEETAFGILVLMFSITCQANFNLLLNFAESL